MLKSLSSVRAISESRPSLKCPENLKTEWLWTFCMDLLINYTEKCIMNVKKSGGVCAPPSVQELLLANSPWSVFILS